MSDSCKAGRPRKGAVSLLAQRCEMALELTAAEALSVADLALELAVSERMARRIVATLRADPNAKRLVIERWGMIERGGESPYYVPIYRKKTERTQRDARKPKPLPRTVRDDAVRRRRQSIEGLFAASVRRSERPSCER